MELNRAHKILGQDYVIDDDELAESVKQFELLGELAFELVLTQSAKLGREK
jgi:hypothetical protein